MLPSASMVRRWAIAMLLVACDRGEAAVAEPAPTGTLRALALVNDPDPAHAQPWAERHALLERLAASSDARRVDRRLNLALDLRQAGDAPDPCAAYGAALGEVERGGDAYFAPHVRETGVPSGCDALAERRASVLARLDPPAASPTPAPEIDRDEPPPIELVGDPPQPDPAQPDPPEPRAAKKPRRAKPGVPPPKVEPTPPPEKPASPAVANKIDEELKPFGL